MYGVDGSKQRNRYCLTLCCARSVGAAELLHLLSGDSCTLFRHSAETHGFLLGEWEREGLRREGLDLLLWDATTCCCCFGGVPGATGGALPCDCDGIERPMFDVNGPLNNRTRTASATTQYCTGHCTAKYKKLSTGGYDGATSSIDERAMLPLSHVRAHYPVSHDFVTHDFSRRWQHVANLFRFPGL